MLILHRNIGQAVLLSPDLRLTVLYLDGLTCQLRLARGGRWAEDFWLELEGQPHELPGSATVQLVRNRRQTRLGLVAPRHVLIVRAELAARLQEALR